MDILDRIRGCLLGLAVGDALGTTLEFKSPGTFTPIDDMVGGGPFDLKPGEWTDDTSMALCLAESLIECNGFNRSDQLERYVRWWKDGHLSSTGECFDIGNTTISGLQKFIDTGEGYAERSKWSAGNGSLMRLAPVAMFYSNPTNTDPTIAISLCSTSSITTHNNIEAIDACAYFGGLILGALNGVSKTELLSKRYCPTLFKQWDEGELAENIEEVASGSFKYKQLPDIIGSGYVVKTLEAALWAFYKTETFRDGALLAVNLGDDADTVGAVYGQIAGAYYGVDGIPSEWLEKLAKRELIESFAERLYH